LPKAIIKWYGFGQESKIACIGSEYGNSRLAEEALEERLAIVRACRYVDEAVAIPLDKGDTDEAYRS